MAAKKAKTSAKKANNSAKKPKVQASKAKSLAKPQAKKSALAPPATERVFTGTPWEPRIAYCRAIRSGDLIAVSGCAPVAEGGGIHAPGDAYAQTLRCLQIALNALAKLGAGPEHVVRTRMFVTDISRWQEYGRAHGEVFAQHPPTTSMIGISALIEQGMLVEVE
ncbi:MAG: RidA family protein, partial [Deltaproteobacteria bacterium]|nr:RidA family protein [Deltaproteobacteria bacterium]